VICCRSSNADKLRNRKDHPFFSGADSRGNYQISNVPLGKARLEVWHPTLGTRMVLVNVSRGGEVIALDIDLKK
jgi:hypothetical protein